MKYGTAGFRDEATKLIEISYDIGRIIAYLTLNSNENYGIMITASHNEYTDNGVKIVGYDGSMIQKKEEEIIENYINKAISIKETYDFISPKKIYIGNDTRESCIKIKEEIIRGIISMSFIIKIVDFGIVSTPQHHYLVKYNNEKVYTQELTSEKNKHYVFLYIYPPSELSLYHHIKQKFFHSFRPK